jgi:hypothetical protein
MALMEACNGFFLGGGLSSPEALYHVSQTLALVQKRLESDEALSDTTIGIILMLILQEQVRKSTKKLRSTTRGSERWSSCAADCVSLSGICSWC